MMGGLTDTTWCHCRVSSSTAVGPSCVFFNGRLLSWSLISGGSIPLVVVEACRMEWGRVCPGLFSLKGWFFVAVEIQE